MSEQNEEELYELVKRVFGVQEQDDHDGDGDHERNDHDHEGDDNRDHPTPF